MRSYPFLALDLVHGVIVGSDIEYFPLECFIIVAFFLF